MNANCHMTTWGQKSLVPSHQWSSTDEKVYQWPLIPGGHVTVGGHMTDRAWGQGSLVGRAPGQVIYVFGVSISLNYVIKY